MRKFQGNIMLEIAMIFLGAFCFFLFLINSVSRQTIGVIDDRTINNKRSCFCISLLCFNQAGKILVQQCHCESRISGMKQSHY